MKRTTQQTSSAALLATGAELSRRGYDVTFTLPNTPRVDMVCFVPDGPSFKIQVKGISTANAFYIDKSFFDRDAQADLFLVVVLVPPISENVPFQFFVLSHADAKKEFSKMPTHKRDGRPYVNGWGLNWGSVKPYENAWNKLPVLHAK